MCLAVRAALAAAPPRDGCTQALRLGIHSEAACDGKQQVVQQHQRAANTVKAADLAHVAFDAEGDVDVMGAVRFELVLTLTAALEKQAYVREWQVAHGLLPDEGSAASPQVTVQIETDGVDGQQIMQIAAQPDSRSDVLSHDDAADTCAAEQGSFAAAAQTSEGTEDNGCEVEAPGELESDSCEAEQDESPGAHAAPQREYSHWLLCPMVRWRCCGMP